jgi:hypothetical protein
MGSKLLMIGAAAAVGAVSAACFSGSSHSPPVSAVSTGTQPLVVACDQVIGRAQSATQDGYRRVLGVFSVPRAYMPWKVVRVHGEGWPYWLKSGMVVRANRSPVTVSVPVAWRNRAAITWGNGTPAVSSVRFLPCPSPPNVWNAYAGGFFLSSRGACVPLVFQVGQRNQVVRFGIDRRCD